MGIKLKAYKPQAVESYVESVEASILNNYNPMFSISYDGEKTPGELGAVKKYIPNFTALRNRSWQAYLESDIAISIINRFKSWVAGAGLKLQYQPEKEILESYKKTIPDKTAKEIELKFRLYCKSKKSSTSQEQTLHELAEEAYLNAIVGGDVLVYLRVVKGQIKVQLIDGEHIFTPYDLGEIQKIKSRGNSIDSGVELDNENRPVAYHILTEGGKFKRLKAWGPKGQRVAFMIKGNNYRLDYQRGLPIIATILEKAGKLDRYTDAAVGGAEERAKIPFFVEHSKDSTGENPLSSQIRGSMNLNRKVSGGSADPYSEGQKLANKIAATTQKQAYNMPIGSKITAVQSDQELNFDKFMLSNLQLIAAAMEAPLEVVLMAFNSNYSASRAALKEWEHTITEKRNKFAGNFYKYIFNLWLMLQDVDKKIIIPGLFEAAGENQELFEAFTNARFIGPNVPHIDPVKEVEAWRRKLGDQAAHIPLATIEQATEALGGGDYDQNINIFKQELKKTGKPKEKEQ